MNISILKENTIKKIDKYKIEIGVVIFLLLGVFILSYSSFPDILENYALDLRFKMRKPEKQREDIVIIEIAQDTLDKLNSRFPIPRRHYAKLITALNTFKPKLIAFDIVFAEPENSIMDFRQFKNYMEKAAGKSIDEKLLRKKYDSLYESGVLSKFDDEIFRMNMKQAGNVFLPYYFTINDFAADDAGFFIADEKQEIYKPFNDVITDSGFINVDLREAIVRKIPLYVKHKGKIYPHIALQLASYVLGIDDKEKVKIDKGIVKLTGETIIPVDENYQMRVNWAGKWTKTFKHYSFIDIINSYTSIMKGEKPLIDLSQFKDKICIVGLTETGLADAKPVPVEDIMPGVGTWLHAINTILTKRFIKHYPVQATFLYSLALMLTAILIIKKWQPTKSIPSVIIMTLLYISFVFFVFNKAGICLDIARPTLLIVLGVVATQSYNYLKLKDMMDLQLTFEQKLVMTSKTGVPLDKQKIGKYQVLGEVGRGGMAIVFKGKEFSTGRIVALKVINPQFSSDVTFKIRFKREANVWMRIKHKNIIEIYELNKQNGVYYFAMEFFPGKGFKERFSSFRKKGEKEIGSIIIQILEGLRACHEKDIVHRDIKPDNILIDDKNIIKITDFGLARPIEDDYLMTTIGQAVGTPAYCAPEQIMGKKVTAKSDIYSLGVLTYEMVVGSLPYQAKTIADLARQKVYGKVTPFPSNCVVSKEFQDIIMKMLAAQPPMRYQSVDEILEDFNKKVEEKESISDSVTQTWEPEGQE